MSDDLPRFDFDALFDDDYLYFYEGTLTGERSDRETDAIWRYAELAEGDYVLDLACGHGRITNRLAKRGVNMTGLDRSRGFLEVARREATETGVAATYIEGDMRALPFDGAFDAVLIWFSAFGYFSDSDNELVLREAFKALKPGGRLIIEQIHRNWLLANFHPTIVGRRDDDFHVDESAFNPLTDRVTTSRTLVRGGKVRSAKFFVRQYGFPELKAVLEHAGFNSAEVFGKSGEKLTMAHPRMVIRARKAQ